MVASPPKGRPAPPRMPASSARPVTPSTARARQPEPRALFRDVPKRTGHRIAVYGPGGIGKTTLATSAPGPVAVVDLDDSLPVLLPKLPDREIRAVAADTWQEIRDALHAPGWDDIGTVVIDSATKAEELALEHTLETIPHEKGHKVSKVEDYGFGKGWRHLYGTFLALLSDLDQHVRAGRHVILVCHELRTKAGNPSGDDYLRHEPLLNSSERSNIRQRVRDWSDHLLFIGYDINVEDGKGHGSGTRTIYPIQLPPCMAKSRKLEAPLPLELNDRTLWELMFAE